MLRAAPSPLPGSESTLSASRSAIAAVPSVDDASTTMISRTPFARNDMMHRSIESALFLEHTTAETRWVVGVMRGAARARSSRRPQPRPSTAEDPHVRSKSRTEARRALAWVNRNIDDGEASSVGEGCDGETSADRRYARVSRCRTTTSVRYAFRPQRGSGRRNRKRVYRAKTCSLQRALEGRRPDHDVGVVVREMSHERPAGLREVLTVGVHGEDRIRPTIPPRHRTRTGARRHTRDSRSCRTTIAPGTSRDVAPVESVDASSTTIDVSDLTRGCDDRPDGLFLVEGRDDDRVLMAPAITQVVQVDAFALVHAPAKRAPDQLPRCGAAAARRGARPQRDEVVVADPVPAESGRRARSERRCTTTVSASLGITRLTPAPSGEFELARRVDHLAPRVGFIEKGWSGPSRSCRR